VQEDLGDGVVARLQPKPLAAASIAQIHEALLADGRDVVLKVRRPGIVEHVELDLDVRSTVRFLEKRSETAQLLQLRALAEELEIHLRDELDLVDSDCSAGSTTRRGRRSPRSSSRSHATALRTSPRSCSRSR
jgi:predicted unusual protein kinase regulating ubiquinone biosynthesis (AarF/ABC1/UbiB family)